MKEKKSGREEHRDVIQRYCPRRGENVIMLRSVGENNRLECMSYDSCQLRKDKFCGGEDSGSAIS